MSATPGHYYMPDGSFMTDDEHTSQLRLWNLRLERARQNLAHRVVHMARYQMMFNQDGPEDDPDSVVGITAQTDPLARQTHERLNEGIARAHEKIQRAEAAIEALEMAEYEEEVAQPEPAPELAPEDFEPEPEQQAGDGVIFYDTMQTDMDAASFREDMNGLSSVINLRQNRKQRSNDNAVRKMRERQADEGKRRTKTVAYGLPYTPLFRSFRDY